MALLILLLAITSRSAYNAGDIGLYMFVVFFTNTDFS